MLSGTSLLHVDARNLFPRLAPDARLLLIRLRSMGDCLLLTSPVRALKAAFPGFRLAVLVDARFAACFSRNPDVEEIIAVQGKASAARRLLARRFDAIINLHGGPTSLLYALCPRGPHIGGSHHQYRWLYRDTYPAPDAALHATESTLGTFRWLGLTATTPPPLRFEPHDEEAGRIRMRLGDTGTPYAVVHPAAAFDTKRWPLERFASAVAWLDARGLRPVLTCGPGEERLLDLIRRMHPHITTLPGLSIPELAELLRGARLYLGNDSGPMHLAAAVGTPSVAIWGSSSAVRWRPWGVEHRVVQNPFSCNPCPGYRCLVAPSPLCIESVTVDQVQDAAAQLLQVER